MNKKKAEENRIRDLEQFKSQFYSKVTKEFQTPLDIVMGITDKLKMLEKDRSLLTKNTKQILGFVNDLLHLNKIEPSSSSAPSLPKKTLEQNKNSAEEIYFLKTISDLVEQNLENVDYGITAICKSLRLSHSQCYRKVKALTGINIKNFIKQIKLEKAHSLLQDTRLSISEITYQIGYKDPNYFSRVFSEYFGYTPSSLRNIPTKK